MPRRLITVFCLGILSLAQTVYSAPEELPAPQEVVPSSTSSFTLIDRWGEEKDFSPSHPLSALVSPRPKGYVIVFLDPGCPLVNQIYAPLLAELDASFRTKGIQFLGIYSNRHVNRHQMASHKQVSKTPFPVFLDPEAKLASYLKATRVPEVFLLDSKWNEIYRGRIDDATSAALHAGEKSPKEEGFLYQALDAFVSDKPERTPSTTARGCNIEFPNQENATAHTDFRAASEVFSIRCLICHHSGGVGRPAFETLGDMEAYASTIAQKVKYQIMPPWNAVPAENHPLLSNLAITDEERRILVDWAERGSLDGAAPEKKLVAPIKHDPKTFSIGNGKPDLVLTLPKPFTVPANKQLEYQFFWIPNPSDEDRWVQEVEFLPGNLDVVHHGQVHLMEKSRRQEFLGKNPDFSKPMSGGQFTTSFYGLNGSGVRHIATYIPGNEMNRLVLPPGQAIRVPGNMDLVLELHYTPAQKDVTDQSKVGFVFAKKPPEREVFNRAFFSRRNITIPPYDPFVSYEVEAYFPKNVILYDARPHMHLRGSDFELVLDQPGKPPETLLSVPAYDFAWQHTYVFEKPIKVPAGATLRTLVHWDNSRLNPHITEKQASTKGEILTPEARAEREASKKIVWGQQSWQEMNNFAVSYFIDEEAEAAAARK